MPLTLASVFSDLSRAALTVPTLFPGCSRDDLRDAPLKHPPSRERLKRPSDKRPDLYTDWLASRRHPGLGAEYLPPGAHRPFTLHNLVLAYNLSRCSSSELLSSLWDMHPYRISVMVTFDLLRGVFPAIRGYSQALMVDEVRVASHLHSLVSSEL